MNIVSWNANCKFREKYKDIAKLEADIYVIQECENPATCKDADYRTFTQNGFWVGNINYKGLMVFSPNPEIKLHLLDWQDGDKRFFLPFRVNDEFTLVGAWACDPYCEELQDWVETVSDKLSQDTVIIGDLNSNVSLDPKHIRKTGKSYGKVLSLIEPIGLTDIWIYYHKEKQGKESVPTFYLYRHLDKPLHLDHCLASPSLVKSMAIHARWQWLALSDHLPIEITIQ